MPERSLASACDAKPRHTAATHPQRDNIFQPPCPGRAAFACQFHHWNMHLNPHGHSIEFAESRSDAQVTEKGARTSPLRLRESTLAAPRPAPMMAIIMAIARMSPRAAARAPTTGSGVSTPLSTVIGGLRCDPPRALDLREIGDDDEDPGEFVCLRTSGFGRYVRVCGRARRYDRRGAVEGKEHHIAGRASAGGQLCGLGASRQITVPFRKHPRCSMEIQGQGREGYDGGGRLPDGPTGWIDHVGEGASRAWQP